MSSAARGRGVHRIASPDAAFGRRAPTGPEAPTPDIDGASFSWSRGKIRVAALVLFAAAALAAVGFASSGSVGSWLWLAMLLGIALLMRVLSRRATTDTAVLTISERGILDRRLMPKPIAWQEIEAICPVDLDRSKVVDLHLRWPADTLAGTRWTVRIGAACQQAYDVPAVTISMLLLDGHVSDVVDAVARYRPDLLSATNRKAPGAPRVHSRR